MFRFLHAADIHLDSPQRGLDRYEGAPVVECRGATRRALENLVDLALAERVAFVAIVGDLYDGDWPDYMIMIERSNSGRIASLSSSPLPCIRLPSMSLHFLHHIRCLTGRTYFLLSTR